MNNTKTFKNEKLIGLIASFIMALMAVAFLLYIVNWPRAYELDPDEGYNVIKALMLEQGFTLYDEIWSDQPPAFTYILWLAFKLFGWDLDVGRVVVIVFVGLMIFGLHDAVRRLYGLPAAIGTVLFLFVTHKFTMVSASVMLGQPTLAMAVMSVWALVVWSIEKRSIFLVLSGIFLGLSISMKMFTLSLVPITLLCIVLYGQESGNRKIQIDMFKPVLFWLLAFTLAGLFFMSPALFSNDPTQLVTAHADTLVKSKHSFGKDLWKFIHTNKLFFIMGVIGLAYTLKNRNIVGVFFGLWLAIALFILYFHYPVWYHHAFLLFIPTSVMAGVSINWLIDFLNNKGWEQRTVFIVGTAVIILLALLSPKINGRESKRITHLWVYSYSKADQRAEKVIEYYAGPERTMITSRPLYTFNTQHIMPPYLAVTSNKRYRAKLWGAESILKDMEKQNTELLVLNKRWHGTPRKKIKDAIKGRYVRVYDDWDNYKLEIFVRKDLVENKPAFEP